MTQKLARFTIEAMIRAGQLYAALPEERGDRPREEKDSLPEVTNPTNKQQAELTLGKSRQTISQWVKMASELGSQAGAVDPREHKGSQGRTTRKSVPGGNTF